MNTDYRLNTYIMPENQSPISNSFNEDFCSYLEYHLTRAFANSLNDEIRWLWCDGIKMPFNDSQLILQNIIETKQIATEAWIGIDGQGIYKMTIKLGPCSLDKIVQGMPLIDCLPGEESLNWVELDLTGKEIQLQLN